MVTRISMENAPQYLIQGVVADRATHKGVRGARVEAWALAERDHDLLGQAVTDDNGSFAIGFDASYFDDTGAGAVPDAFFKVSLDGHPVLDTSDQPTKLAVGETKVKLEIALAEAQPQGRDRVSVEQTLKAVDWWRASDFVGAAKESGARMGTVLRMMGSVAGRAFASDWKPVRPANLREGDVVQQDVNQAQRALAVHQVEVSQVRDVGSDTFTRSDLLKGYPVALNPGDRVTLYQENGVVRYYTRDAAPAAAPADAEAVGRMAGDLEALKAQVRGMEPLRTDVDNLKSSDDTLQQQLAASTAALQKRSDDVARLERELNDVRNAAAAKDAEIVQLRTDLTQVRTATDNLATRIPLARIEALETQLRTLQTPGIVRPAPTPAPDGGHH